MLISSQNSLREPRRIMFDLMCDPAKWTHKSNPPTFPTTLEDSCHYSSRFSVSTWTSQSFSHSILSWVWDALAPCCPPVNCTVLSPPSLIPTIPSQGGGLFSLLHFSGMTRPPLSFTFIFLRHSVEIIFGWAPKIKNLYSLQEPLFISCLDAYINLFVCVCVFTTQSR